MRYRVQSVNITNQPSQNQFTMRGHIFNVPSNEPLQIELTIAVYDTSAMSKLNSIEDVEKFLENNTTPEWATSEMIIKALKKEYPERFL